MFYFYQNWIGHCLKPAYVHRNLFYSTTRKIKKAVKETEFSFVFGWLAHVDVRMCVGLLNYLCIQIFLFERNWFFWSKSLHECYRLPHLRYRQLWNKPSTENQWPTKTENSSVYKQIPLLQNAFNDQIYSIAFNHWLFTVALGWIVDMCSWCVKTKEFYPAYSYYDLYGRQSNGVKIGFSHELVSTFLSNRRK